MLLYFLGCVVCVFKLSVVVVPVQVVVAKGERRAFLYSP